MIESQRRLYDLGIFARVDTALQNPDGDTDQKYVLYRFEEASRYSLTGGFGAQLARIGRGNPTFNTPAGAADSVHVFRSESADRISWELDTRSASKDDSRVSSVARWSTIRRLSSRK